MKTVNNDKEILQIFWMTWEISMKFSGKMWLMIILKVSKFQGFRISLEDTFFEKPQTANLKLTPPSSRFRVNFNGEKMKIFFDQV